MQGVFSNAAVYTAACKPKEESAAMTRQVQIDWDLFCNLVDYFQIGGEYQGEEWLANDIRTALNAKIDKIIARELFTRYKRTPTGAEREQARKEYLDHICKPRGFRTDEEWHEEEPPEDLPD